MANIGNLLQGRISLRQEGLFVVELHVDLESKISKKIKYTCIFN